MRTWPLPGQPECVKRVRASCMTVHQHGLRRKNVPARKAERPEAAGLDKVTGLVFVRFVHLLLGATARGK